MVATGDIVDLSFTVKVVCAGVVKEMTFRDLVTRPTVVSVYMKNKTPGCDRQNDSLVTVAAALEKAGFGLIAVSRDTTGSHLRYAAARAIPYPLVSDPADCFARATGSLVEKSMYGRTFTGPARTAYLVERSGRVLGVVGRVDPAKHAEQVNELIKPFINGGRI